MRPLGEAAAIATTQERSVTLPLLVVLVVILLSGALFGYDQGVISGALHGIEATFSLSALLVEVVTSWVTPGAFFGALAGGELAWQDLRQHARGTPASQGTQLDRTQFCPDRQAAHHVLPARWT